MNCAEENKENEGGRRDRGALVPFAAFRAFPE